MHLYIYIRFFLTAQEERYGAPWENLPSNMKKYQSMSMDTLIENLYVVIGKPYIFRHNKECDHMIVFTDI